MIVVDSGAVSRFAAEDSYALSVGRALRATNQWPPMVPTVVLVESLQGDPGRDARANRFLKSCDVRTDVPVTLARRAALLRRLAQTGSAVDALVVALAEPGGTVLTTDKADIEALARYANGVRVEVV